MSSDARSDIELIGKNGIACIPKTIKINGVKVLAEWARVSGGIGDEPVMVTIRFIPTSLKVTAEEPPNE